MLEGLIPGKLNKEIEMKGFWSCSKLNFYKKKSLLVERQEIVLLSSEAFSCEAMKKFPIFVSGHLFQNEKI